MTSWINHFNHTKYSKDLIHRIMKKLETYSVIKKKKRNTFSQQLKLQRKINLLGIFMPLLQMKSG